MKFNCNKIWTQLVSVAYRIRRQPMVTITPPPKFVTRQRRPPVRLAGNDPLENP